MGPVGLLLFATGLSSAWAGKVGLALYLPGGVPAPGDVAEVHVVTHDGGVAVEGEMPGLSIDGEKIDQIPRAIGPGRWAFTLPAAGAAARRLDVRAGISRLSRTLGPASVPAVRLRVPKSQEAEVGQMLVFRVSSARGPLPSPEQIAVLGTDGHLVDVRETEDEALEVRWQTGSAPFPRALALGVQDLRAPQVPPAWTVASLRGRPSVPIHTDPGAKVTLIVGGRPEAQQIADSDGLVTVQPEVRPGENTAIVVTEDELGNTQRSEIALGGDARPVLTVVSSSAIVPGRRMPHIYLHATRPSGRAWNGEAPVCRTTRSGLLKLAELSPGQWRSQVPPDLGDMDLRVHCELGSSLQTLSQVRIEADLPTRLTLRAHPTVLTTDLPSAEIQAFLENALGDRLPSQTVRLRADRGDLTESETQTSALVRAVYRGDRAVSSGGDTIRAGVILPPGEGGIWSLDLAAAAPQGRTSVLIDGRALDRHGRPLAGVPLALRLPGRTVEVVTGQRGWASVELPWPKTADLVVVEVAGGGMVRRLAVLPGDPVVRDIGGPDLTATLDLPIQAGRINGVSLIADPRVVESGGPTSAIQVRLEDRSGKIVVDQEVEITADVGEVGPLHRRQDGVLQATYAPPIDLVSGDARIRASTLDGRFSASTNIVIVPPRLRQSLGFLAGVISASGGAARPYFAMEYDSRMPWEPFVFRASVAYYQRVAKDTDELTGGTVELDLKSLPISVGVLARQGGRNIPSWFGASIVGALQQVNSRLDGVEVADGVQVAPPGFQLSTGVGWRFRRGELQAQLAYLFMYGQPYAVGWPGPVGGVVGTLGYKVLY